MKYFKVLFLIHILLLFYSCGSVKEGFVNQKKNSNDEFFVEKNHLFFLNYNELIPSKKQITDEIKIN